MRIGVIGVGWWGKNIVNTLESSNRIESVVVFDERKEAYAKVRANKKIEYADSMEALLSDPSVSGICLATPPVTHFEYSKRILMSDKHLLVEKPPAYETAQIQELGMIAEGRKLVYMLDALYLFLDPIQSIKKMLDTGELKNLRYIQMFRIGDEMRRAGAGIQRLQQTMFANGVDVIEDLFFHDAAILLKLFGDFEFCSVEKQHMYHPTLCDTARIKLMVKGIPAELTLSWTLAGRRRGMVLYDRDCVVEYDGLKTDNQITKYDLAKNQSEVLSFAPVAPLGALLDYYLNCMTAKESNVLGAKFMERITTVWRAMADERE